MIVPRATESNRSKRDHHIVIGFNGQYPTHYRKHTMAHLFQFEQDFVDSLRCIPMQVRMKLDTCGVKLKLDQWNHFTLDDRQSLLDRPCTSLDEATAYKQFLTDLIQQRTGQQAKEIAVVADPDWENAQQIPEIVKTKAATFELQLQLAQWAQLRPIQRFALIKLSRSSHENSNFIPALKEFGLIPE